MRHALAAALALSALVGAPAAQARQAMRSCVDRDDAASLVLAVAPDLIRATGRKCAGALPADSLLEQPSSRLMTKYRRAADGAWAGAKRALQGMGGGQLGPLLTGDFARGMVGPLLAPGLTQNIAPDDCPKIDRIVTLLEPLPAQNTARLLVALYEMSDGGKKLGGKATMPTIAICDNKRG